MGYEMVVYIWISMFIIRIYLDNVVSDSASQCLNLGIRDAPCRRNQFQPQYRQGR